MPFLYTPTLIDLLAILDEDPGHADAVFDRCLPAELRTYSRVHWTEVVAAFRVADLLESWGAVRLLDIGSGAGKLCVAAALATRCSFVGLEYRPRLVDAARLLARRFRVGDRVRFIEGALGSVRLPVYDVLYCYNPFGENLFEPAGWLDGTVDLGLRRHAQDVELLEGLLDRTRVGTRLITYNGSGTRVPGSFDLIGRHRDLPSELCVWHKVRADSEGRWHLEEA
jgi:SAM-dependent methyltransferase